MEDQLVNFSRTDDDPFADISLSTAIPYNTSEIRFRWNPSTIQIIIHYFYIAFELTKFFLAIGSTLADILLIYLILRYKRLRKNFNMYILHYAIMNLIYYVLAPLLFIVHALFSVGFYYFRYIYCYVGMIEATCLYMSFVFAFCLALDWAIMCFKPNLLNNIQLAYKFKFTLLYVLCLILIVFNCIGCIWRHEIIIFFVMYTIPLMVIGLLVIHYHRRQKVIGTDHLKTEYSLWISSIAIGCYIPTFLLDVLYRMMSEKIFREISMAFFLLEYLLALIYTPSPILVLYYLNKWNKHVKMAYDTTFKKAVRTYGADNLDDASDNEEIVEDGGEKNIQINTNGLDTQTIMVP